MNPTNRSTKTDIEEWLKPTLEKEGLQSYSTEISGNTEKGDGYLGDITFVEVSGKTKTDEFKSYSLVMKCGKKSKELRDVMPIREAFENEIYFYNKILPAFVEFQKEKNVQEPFINAAKCYDTLILEEMEVLVLDNLKAQGYNLHNRYNPMDKKHIRKVVKTYGKLHAISFALRDQKPELFKKLSENLTDLFKIFAKNEEVQDDMSIYQTIINLANEENDDTVVEKALLLHEKSKYYNEITDPTDPYAVILHGDCWNNNFMFKYQDEAKTVLSDIRLLDFQLSRLASPVYDLSYFLFTCLSEEDIQNFDEINGIYYESFANFLIELGSDPKKLFPFEELLNQWKRFSLFGLILLPSIIKICVTDKDEVPDLVEAAESGTSFATVFTEGVKEIEQYRKRTLPIMRLVIDKAFI